MTTPATTNAPPRIALRLTLAGRVQGIGLRPAIARLARQRSLAGFVANTREGVELHVEGPAADVEQFEHVLLQHLPEAAQVSSLRGTRVEPAGLTTFALESAENLPASVSHEPSSATDAALAARVPTDVVVCDACLAETRQATDRRHRYPFTSCTDCGPRYAIIDRMPYEREQTSYATFPFCGRCRREYGAPDQRRFHAQTNACPRCGPRIWLRDRDERIVARDEASIHAAAEAILAGRIVALRGLGGYQLLVDATSEAAVDRLRRRKRRPSKPLAVMVASASEAGRLARLDDAEQRLLRDPAGPIVVAPAADPSILAPAINAELQTIGLMLPTTPLHGLLLEAVGRPLVCTSGNVEGEPLAYDANAALAQLRDVVDVWLEHDRPIRRPIDDSIVRVMAGRPVALRLARGYAPRSLDLPTEEPLIALGGHQKNAIALCNGAQSVLGPHVGDLSTVATRQRFVDHLAELTGLYGSGDGRLVCDVHPEYFTTQWAEDRSSTVVRVQHHHAHIVAGMLEHGWLDRQVLGVALDGSGYGTDGTIWGGEFLLATSTGFQRVGHLRPLRLAGGEAAIAEPWRVATALVREALGDEVAARLVFHTGNARSLLPVLQSPRLSPTTSSAGRLFDGVAALVLGVEQSQFEGEAAMRLEAASDPAASARDEDVAGYDLIIGNSRPVQLDWRPLVRRIVRDRAAGVAPAELAWRFHQSVARAVFRVSQSHASLPVVLGGGVFQNRLLVELIVEQFAATGQPLGLPGMIPPNDGGLAAGQLCVAAAEMQQRRTMACV